MKTLWRIVMALAWGIGFSLGVINIDSSLLWLMVFVVAMIAVGCFIVALDTAPVMPDDYDEPPEYRNLY